MSFSEITLQNLIEVNHSVDTAVTVISLELFNGFAQKASRTNPSWRSAENSGFDPSTGTLIAHLTESCQSKADGPSIGEKLMDCRSYFIGWINKFLTFISLMLKGRLFFFNSSRRMSGPTPYSFMSEKSRVGSSVLNVGNIFFLKISAS